MRVRFLHIITALCTCFGLLSATSCGESDSMFCSLPANFTVSNVYAVPQLYTSLNSMGEFCTIRAINSQYVYANTQGSTSVNKTALSNYSGFYLGLCGFIVGLPNIPEMGYDQSRVVCFDLACPNCYTDYNVTKRMTLQTGGYVLCGSCGRTYDLNNLGLVSSGEAGRALYRYRISYVSDAMIIANR